MPSSRMSRVAVAGANIWLGRSSRCHCNEVRDQPPASRSLDAPIAASHSMHTKALLFYRVVKNISSTGRTICCTIHQPSIDVFEVRLHAEWPALRNCGWQFCNQPSLLPGQAFDELVLLKRGGVIIYSGTLGQYSADMVGYFESIPGVPPIANSFNPVRQLFSV